MQVTLPEGTTYLLVIDTDAYSGNFERELCAYATGLWSEEMHHGETEALDALADDEGIVISIRDKSQPQMHDEHRVQVVESIRATPGRCNDGRGGHMDADSDEARGQRTFPAYESVAVFLSAPLGDKEMAFVRRRAEAYAARAERFRPAFTIRDIYQVVSETTVTERRLG